MSEPTWRLEGSTHPCLIGWMDETRFIRKDTNRVVAWRWAFTRAHAASRGDAIRRRITERWSGYIAGLDAVWDEMALDKPKTEAGLARIERAIEELER